MSDLRPQGIPVELGGVERNFLFTLNVIDQLESQYDMTMLDIFEKAMQKEGFSGTIQDIVLALLNDEEERTRYENPDTTLKKTTKQEVGWMVNMENLGKVRIAILRAYGISVPEPEDPNQEGGQQNS